MRVAPRSSRIYGGARGKFGLRSLRIREMMNRTKICADGAAATDGAPIQSAVGSIYTTGYTGRVPEDLPVLAARLNAVVVDVRYSANSRHPFWRQADLRRLLSPARYIHLPEFGNVNYRGDKPVCIKDFDHGFIRLEEILRAGNAAILLCACREIEKCHRNALAQSLRLKGFETKELESWQFNDAPLFA